MPNPVLGEVALGDYTLAFNFGAFCELEEVTGKKTQDLLTAMAEGLSFSQLRDFVWAGLQTHHKATQEATLQLLNEQGYEAAGQAVAKAITSFFGTEKEKAKNPRKAAA